jgi:hypothetical protein
MLSSTTFPRVYPRCPSGVVLQVPPNIGYADRLHIVICSFMYVQNHATGYCCCCSIYSARTRPFPGDAHGDDFLFESDPNLACVRRAPPCYLTSFLRGGKMKKQKGHLDGYERRCQHPGFGDHEPPRSQDATPVSAAALICSETEGRILVFLQIRTSRSSPQQEGFRTAVSVLEVKDMVPRPCA